MTMF